MDKERRKKLQTTKLVITEIFMLIIIVLTVIILTFVVMGYRLTEDGKLEQSGLVQVDSMPTGATVTIDDEVLSSYTNTSKILPEGEHTIKIEKPGFSSWQKMVDVRSGLLTNLTYPRLFKIDREVETIKTLDEAPALYSIAPNREIILLAFKNSPKFKVLRPEPNTPKETEIDLKNLLTEDKKLPSSLKIINWSKDSNRFILSFEHEDGTHFAVVDLNHPENSLDLTTTFDLKISSIDFSSRGDELYIVENGHLRTLSISTSQLSKILVSDVESIDGFDSRIGLVRKTSTNKNEFAIFDSVSESITTLGETDLSAQILISEYLGRPTLAMLKGNEITVFRGDLPTEDITDSNPMSQPVGKYTLNSDESVTFEMAAKDQVVLASSGTSYGIFDLENYSTSFYTLEEGLTFWPDEYTIGNISNNRLILRDFDGTNRIDLGSAISGYAAVITKDNRYLCLVQKDEKDKLNIVRETIR